MPLEKHGSGLRETRDTGHGRSGFLREKYIQKLDTRRKESHVYRRFQLIGLELADLLGDRPHKALYIKLAKERNIEELMSLAKRIAEQEHIQKKGAYFMACLSKMKIAKIKMKSDKLKK